MSRRPRKTFTVYRYAATFVGDFRLSEFRRRAYGSAEIAANYNSGRAERALVFVYPTEAEPASIPNRGDEFEIVEGHPGAAYAVRRGALLFDRSGEHDG